MVPLLWGPESVQLLSWGKQSSKCSSKPTFSQNHRNVRDDSGRMSVSTNISNSQSPSLSCRVWQCPGHWTLAAKALQSYILYWQNNIPWNSETSSEARKKKLLLSILPVVFIVIPTMVGSISPYILYTLNNHVFFIAPLTSNRTRINIKMYCPASPELEAEAAGTGWSNEGPKPSAAFQKQRPPKYSDAVRNAEAGQCFKQEIGERKKKRVRVSIYFQASMP